MHPDRRSAPTASNDAHSITSDRFHDPDLAQATLSEIYLFRTSNAGRIKLLDVCGLNSHESVNHSKKDYVCGDVFTKSVESAFSLLKSGIVGRWHKKSARCRS